MAEFERLYGDPDNPQGPDRAPPEFMAQMVAQMRADIEGMQFNHEIPVVLSLRATWEGGLWVRRRREGDPWEGAVGVIDVWNPDRRYVGRYTSWDTASIPSVGAMLVTKTTRLSPGSRALGTSIPAH